VHYWVDLQSVHGLHCYDNIVQTRNVSACTRSMPGYAYCKGKNFENRLAFAKVRGKSGVAHFFPDTDVSLLMLMLYITLSFEILVLFRSCVLNLLNCLCRIS